MDILVQAGKADEAVAILRAVADRADRNSTDAAERLPHLLNHPN